MKTLAVIGRTGSRDLARQARQIRADTVYPPGLARPRTRAECLAERERFEPGPCPWVSCEFHTYLTVTDSGLLKTQFDVELEDMPGTCCVLDFVEAHPEGGSLQDVGDQLGLTRERTRQIEEIALYRMKQTEGL